MKRCGECGSSRGCMCQCRRTIKAVGVEIEAALLVVERARFHADHDTELEVLLELYDAAVHARRHA